MGLRSYLMVDSGQGYAELLEANNVVPLLWLAMLTRADLAQGLNAVGPTLRLADGAAHGLTIGSEAALTSLARRRATLVPWLGDDGADIFDAFAGFMAQQDATHVHIDLAEWVDASDSVQDTVAEFEAIIDALDTPPPKTLPAKRRPKQIKWLLEQFGLTDPEEDPARFAYVLGGASSSVREPWRRERPRERRLHSDRLYWSNSDPVVSNNGRTVVVKVKNNEHVETALIWSLDSGRGERMPIDDSIGHAHVSLVSGDGRVVFGTASQFPGPVSLAFSYDGTRFDTVGDDEHPTIIVWDCSADGAVAVGARRTGKYGDPNERAFYWRPGQAAIEFLALDCPSSAALVSADGRFIAGTYVPASPAEDAPTHAYVWDDKGGLENLGPAFEWVEWLALSPDGQRGVLEGKVDGDSEAAFLFWCRGGQLRPIGDADGQPLSNLRISAAVDAVLGDFADGSGDGGAVLLWRPDQPVRRIALAGEGELWPVYVADGGVAAVIQQENPANRAPSHMLVWTEEDGVRSSPVNIDGEQLVGGFWARNRSPTLDGFVTVGKRRSDYFPYIWTARGGVEMFPGDVELARAPKPA